MLSVSEILSGAGPLAKSMSGFAPRVQQQQMAEVITKALEQKQVVVAEAGTGTGKTFAYLVPSLLSGKKVLISTGTKNLQDQFFYKDLPVVQQALDIPVSVALLKGRANYLCPHRLYMAQQESQPLNKQALNKLRIIMEWAGRTRTGDRSEVNNIAEDDMIWPRVTSSADNCLGQECPKLQECHLMQARRAAQAADVVVINHHLLFADMALREQGFGELLPQADAVVIDEAHHLMETAASFFGTSLSGNQILELCRDSEAEFYQEINEGHDFPKVTADLEKAVRDLRLAMGEARRRGRWNELSGQQSVQQSIQQTQTGLETLLALLKPLAERGKGLENCHRRAKDLTERFVQLTGADADGFIHWFETHRRTFTLHLTPLDISEVFQGHMQSIPGAWIFTSATLSVNGNFDHFINQLGLQQAQSYAWESPFDYASQAMLYLPKGLPEPNQQHFTASVMEKALPVLKSSGGRAFLLFTSHRALREAADLLKDQLAYPILIQGEAPRDILLERFRSLGNAILLGTSSFWEGVDVRGEALSCVIIDKLPFASPGDPVLQARLEAIRQQGMNPFMSHQLPSAVITLKQGAGRLIRDSSDTGILMICDPRLRSKPYGRVFIASLPPMPVTDSEQEVADFFTRVASRPNPTTAVGKQHEAPCH